MEQRQDDLQLKEKRLAREVIYTGTSYQLWLDELLLPDGSRVQREHVHHPGGVAVLAVDDRGRCAMVRQYRHPIEQITTEIPAGKLDKMPNETPEHAALRELREETGYIAKKITLLGKVYPSPGILDEVLYLFLAHGLKKAEQELDDDEFIRVLWLPLEELKKKIASGDISDMKTICAVAIAEEQIRRI